MGVSSSRSRGQTLPLTWCSIGGAWSAVPLPPPQRSVRWPAPLSSRVLITQYRVAISIWSENGAEPIQRFLVYCCFKDFKGFLFFMSAVSVCTLFCNMEIWTAPLHLQPLVHCFSGFIKRLLACYSFHAYALLLPLLPPSPGCGTSHRPKDHQQAFDACGLPNPAVGRQQQDGTQICFHGLSASQGRLIERVAG